jgi:hypothetical protein
LKESIIYHPLQNKIWLQIQNKVSNWYTLLWMIYMRLSKIINLIQLLIFLCYLITKYIKSQWIPKFLINLLEDSKEIKAEIVALTISIKITIEVVVHKIVNNLLFITQMKSSNTWINLNLLNMINLKINQVSILVFIMRVLLKKLEC